MSDTSTSELNLSALSKRVAPPGAVILAVCVAAGLSNHDEFYRSYLVAFLFWLGISLGSLGLLMVQHLTGGRWAVVIRRFLEASSRTLPLMAVAALPLLAGMRTLYVWSRPGESDPAILAKHGYLNPQFFVVRMVVFFAIWLGMAHFLNKWSREEDTGGGGLPLKIRIENLSGIGILIYCITATFASIDWVMSIEPRWYSTIYGLIFVTGQAVAALAFCIMILIWLSGRKPMAGFIKPAQFQDLGSFLLAFVMLWAYMDFSQFIITWGGNLSAEIPWYIRRMHGVWGQVGLVVVIASFALPFFLLLFRHVKRRTRSLAIVTGLVLLTRLVDMYWMVLPAFGGGDVRLNWMDVALPLGFGAIWFSYFLWQLDRMPILPVHDPRIEQIAGEAVEHA